MAQRRGDLVQRDAVDADRQYLRIAAQRGQDLRQRRAVAEMLAVAKGEGEPGAERRELLQQRQQRLQFGERRQRFAGQQIDAGGGQGCEARAVEGNHVILCQPVVAAVFRTVGQIGAVRAHRTGDQQRRRLRVCGQIIVARALRQLHAFGDQRQRLILIQAAAQEALRRGLITGGDGALGAGVEIIEVYLIDKLGIFNQHLGRPQRIGQIAAARFQLGGQRAVQDQRGVFGQQAGDRVVNRHVVLPKRFFARRAGSGNR